MSPHVLGAPVSPPSEGPLSPDVEVVSAREPSSRTYRRADGSLRREVALGGLNYRDDSGLLQPISTEVRKAADGKLVNETNTLMSRFPALADGVTSVTSLAGGVELSWRPAGVSLVLPDGSLVARVAPRRVPSTLDGASAVLQADLYPGISERYRIGVSRLEHELELTAEAAGAWSGSDAVLRVAWEVDAGAGRIVAAKSGGFHVEDAAGRPCFSLPPPFVVAGAPACETDAPALGFELETEGRPSRLVLQVPVAMLAAATALQPLVIDPTVVDLNLEPRDVIVYGSGVARHLTHNQGLAFGDLDDDGMDDLVVGEGLTERRQIRVLTGPRPNGTSVDLRVDTGDMTLNARAWHFDLMLATADLSGDGRTDLIVGGGSADDSSSHGQVFVYFGPLARGTVIDDATEHADVQIIGVDPDAWFGLRLATGEFNGDGKVDLAIGAARADDPQGRRPSGDVSLLFGPFARGTVRDLSVTPADVVIRGCTFSANGNLGSSLAGGDVSGDGIGDLLLGTGSGDCYNPTPAGCPRVHVLFGRPRSAWPSVIDLSTQPADVTLRASPGDERTPIASGDISGDGFPDLLVGQAEYSLPGFPGLGRVVACFGPLSSGVDLALDAAADAVVLGAISGDNMPSSLCSGDVNGDGIADLVIGVEGATGLHAGWAGGEIDVVLGPLAQDDLLDLAQQRPDLYISGEAPEGMLGETVVVADYSGDGIPDVASGSIHQDGLGGSPACTGRAYVVFSHLGECELPPEVTDLRVTRPIDPADESLLTWAAVPPRVRLRCDVYRGSIGSLHARRVYDHAAVPGGCGLEDVRFEAPRQQEEDVYYLVGASIQGELRPCEGPLGDARIGELRIPRPSARGLGTSFCP